MSLQMGSPMIKIIRTNSEHPDFIELVRALDLDLAERDGLEYAFYAQFNKIDRIKFVVIAYDDKLPVGCGAIKEYALDTMEVKRMYTAPTHRGHGIASRVLRELEDWAAEMSYAKCVLETGKKTAGSCRSLPKEWLRAHSQLRSVRSRREQRLL